MQLNNSSKKLIRLDIKKAILSPFSGEKWKSKIFILTLFSLFCALLETIGLSFLSWIPTIIFNGYCAQFIYNEIHNITPLLPEWHANFLKYFKYGFIFTIITIIYSIIIILIVFNFIKLSYNAKIIPILFIFSVIYFWVSASYCDNFKFSEAFATTKFFKLILRIKWEFLITILIIFGSIIICYKSGPFLVKFNLSQNIIGMIIALLSPFILLFIDNLLAQAYKAGGDL